MSLPHSTRHRRPHWVVSGAFWTLLVLADMAMVSIWAVFGTMLLAAGCVGSFALIRRRLVAAAGARAVEAPAGGPLAGPAVTDASETALGEGALPGAELDDRP
jgi:hypothetical protein